LKDQCGGSIGFDRFPADQPRRALARHARKVASALVAEQAESCGVTDTVAATRVIPNVREGSRLYPELHIPNPLIVCASATSLSVPDRDRLRALMSAFTGGSLVRGRSDQAFS
jgi:hypothetical protein